MNEKVRVGEDEYRLLNNSESSVDGDVLLRARKIPKSSEWSKRFVVVDRETGTLWAVPATAFLGKRESKSGLVFNSAHGTLECLQMMEAAFDHEGPGPYATPSDILRFAKAVETESGQMSEKEFVLWLAQQYILMTRLRKN